MSASVLLASPVAFGMGSSAGGSEGDLFVPPGRWVWVNPRLGKVPRPIRLYVTDLELSVVSDIQRMISGFSLSDEVPLKEQDVTWYVEESAKDSPTYRLQRSILFAVNRVIDGRMEIARQWPFTIVVARTQKYIREVLDKLNCHPNLDLFDGKILMGAALCNRRVVVSNITGYLFLLRADQKLTPDLEVRRERPIAETPYRVVSRNASALAHEFIHIWRAAGLSGRVHYDEPAWFSEGFAEFWSGVGEVLAYPRRVNYLSHHVVRVRDFNDWSNTCTEHLSAYRKITSYVNGCEYHVGLAAVEYLFSRYSSVQTTLDAFARADEYDSFEEGFLGTFGITLAHFEDEATRYVQNLRMAERLG